jgi:hypothetical protein
MEFHGTILKEQLYLSIIQKELRQQFLASLKDGTLIKETLTKRGQNKTYQQVKAFWGMVITMTLAEFDDRGWDTSYLLNMDKPTGIAISKDLLKEYFYAVCPVFDENGKRITLSKMTIEQAMKQFEMVRNFAASQWSIYIPDPDPNWREKKNGR